ncbi:MAG: hypothetical protein FWH11_00405 [Micrococcales bacterium]|nr:hypothetical protein [Micrococcales bacterium]
MDSHSVASMGPAADLRADLVGAFGLPVWGAVIRTGPSFALNLGQPDLVDPQRGQWRLWVYSAAWRIETSSAVLGASEYDRESREAAIVMLNGKALVGVDVETPSLSAVFDFSDGVRLRTFSFTRNYHHWVLFRPDGMVRVAGPASSWGLEQA